MLFGATEYLDWVQDELEDTAALGRDDSSARLLSTVHLITVCRDILDVSDPWLQLRSGAKVTRRTTNHFLGLTHLHTESLWWHYGLRRELLKMERVRCEPDLSSNQNLALKWTVYSFLSDYL